MSNASTSNTDLRRRVEQLERLPPLPEVAQRLLELRDNPQAGAKQLASVIELDPSLAGQVLRYAASPLLGCRAAVASIQDAITRLGYDRVTHLALGFTAARGFVLPEDGPIGLHAFWRHAVYSAALMQMLAPRVPTMRPGLAYLGGLLHDIGLLVLGHLAPAEFQALNKACAQHPDRPLTELEHERLGLSHTEIGVWLMRYWRMPGEIVTAVYAHHDANFHGEHAVYANLACIADRLLRPATGGDGADAPPPGPLLRKWSLDADELSADCARLLAEAARLDAIAAGMMPSQKVKHA